MPFFGGGTGDYFIVGTNVKGGNQAAPAVIGDNNMALGNGALQSAINADRNIAIGNGALNACISPLDVVSIGYLSNNLTVNADTSVAIGSNSAESIGFLTSSVIIGHGAASESNLISDAVAIGLNAFASPAGHFDRAQGAVAIGAGAGYGYETNYNNSVLIGSNAGTNNGVVAGQFLTSVFIGTNCGSSNVNANYQDCIGIGANTYFGDGTAATQLGAIVIGANSGPSPSNTDISNSIAIGYTVPVTGPNQIIIGDASHTSVMIGGINIGNVSTGNFGANRLYTDDYFAAGVDSNSATVNGSAITAKLALWVDDGGTNMAGGGIGKADDTVATAGATWFLGRSRGTLAAPTIVQNGDLLGGVIALGNDGTDFATAARIDFEVDGTPGNNDMPGRIVFKTAPDGSQTVAEVARITQDKYLRMAAGSLGIQFGGDTAAANALDDYEEGTFTPTFTCSTPGNLAVVYAAQDGRYVKIGSLVTFSVLISCTPTFTTASGFIRVGGLPFTGIGAAPSYNQAGAIAVWNAPAGFVSQLGRISGTNYVTFLRLSNNGSANSSVSITEIPSATPNVIFITGSYEV